MNFSEEGCGRADREYRLDWCTLHARSIWECFQVVRTESLALTKKLDSFQGEIIALKQQVQSAEGLTETFKATLKESELQIRDLMDFTRNIETNYDCDGDAHKYNTNCRACAARKLREKYTEKRINLRMP